MSNISDAVISEPVWMICSTAALAVFHTVHESGGSDSVLAHIQCEHMGGSGVWCLVPKCATALKLSTAQTAVQQCFALMQ